MQIGNLAQDDAFEHYTKVHVNGVERDIESVTITHEIAGDLPSPIAAVSGISFGSGSITFAAPKDTSTMGLTPFNASSGLTPRKGDTVEVLEGDGRSWWQVFTGIIDSVTGDTTGSISAEIISKVDTLNRDFRHAPLQRIMPPRTRGAAEYRGVGLTHMYFVDAALRIAGYYAVPPKVGRVGVSAPLQSSLWPETGVLTRSTVGGVDGGAWVSNHQGDGALAVGNLDATYQSAVTDARGSTLEISLTLAEGHGGGATVAVQAGVGDITVAYGPQSISVSAGGSQVATLPSTGGRVTVALTQSTCEVRTSRGATATGALPFSVAGAVLGAVTVRAGADARIAGLQVGYVGAPDRWKYVAFTPTARYNLSKSLTFSIMDASPLIEKIRVRDFLEQVAEATLSAMWIDELGVLQWAAGAALTAADPARTVTTADDVLALRWVDDSLQERSQVTVAYRVPACTRSRYDNVIFYQGNGESRESSQYTASFVKADGDVDWISDITPPLVLGDPGAVTLANAGRGSIAGGIITDSGSGQEGVAEPTAAGLLSIRFEKINANTYKYEEMVGQIPEGKKIFTSFHTYSTSIWRKWWGQGLPIFRGFGKTEWADAEITAAASPHEWAGELTHDMGVWVAREGSEKTIPTRVLNFLAAQCSSPAPYVTGLEILPDPRLQVGDVLEVKSPLYLGVTFTGLVVKAERKSGGGASLAQDIRLLSMKSDFTTYEAWDAAHPGALDYRTFSTLSQQNYTTFSAEKD